MGIHVQWVPDEPILTATAEGMIACADFIDMYHQVNELMQDAPTMVYRIGDYTNATSSFMDILHALKEASSGAGGSAVDPRVKTIYVGTSHWIGLARNALQQPQFGHIQIPTFTSLDEALEYARREIAKEQSQTTSG